MAARGGPTKERKPPENERCHHRVERSQSTVCRHSNAREPSRVDRQMKTSSLLSFLFWFLRLPAVCPSTRSEKTFSLIDELFTLGRARRTRTSSSYSSNRNPTATFQRSEERALACRYLPRSAEASARKSRGTSGLSEFLSFGRISISHQDAYLTAKLFPRKEFIISTTSHIRDRRDYLSEIRYQSSSP